MPHSSARPNRSERLDFTEALVADLHAVLPAPALRPALAGWVGFGLLSTALFVFSLGSLRGTALADLATPRLALELLFGSATLITLARAALEAGVPGGPGRGSLLAPPLFFAALWLGVALGVVPLPGPDAAMIGKRAHCFLEGLGITALPALVGVHMIRHRSLRTGALTGGLIGLAAGTFPALAMQLACLYDPVHALRFHFTPMLAAAAALGLLGAHRVDGD